jgi:hypothetical protein
MSRPVEPTEAEALRCEGAALSLPGELKRAARLVISRIE